MGTGTAMSAVFTGFAYTGAEPVPIFLQPLVESERLSVDGRPHSWMSHLRLVGWFVCVCAVKGSWASGGVFSIVLTPRSFGAGRMGCFLVVKSWCGKGLRCRAALLGSVGSRKECGGWFSQVLMG
jgi:hypothetical protein